jgi:phage-related minor tail protein
VGRLDSQIEVLQKQNKSIIDIRFGEMWSVLNELKAQLTILETYKRKQDMSLKQNFKEVQDQLDELTHSLLKATNRLSAQIKKADSVFLERQAELAGTVWQELDERDAKWTNSREEATNDMKHKLHELETLFQSTIKQQSIHYSNELTGLDKQLKHLNDSYKESHNQINKNISTLTESVSLLEKEIHINKKHMSSVMEAEIKTRREEILNLQMKCIELQENCRRLHESLQTMLGKLHSVVAQNNTAVRKAISGLKGEWQVHTKLLLADIGTRLSSLHVQMEKPHKDEAKKDDDNDDLEKKLSEQFNKRFDDMAEWHQKYERDVQEIQNKLIEVHRIVMPFHIFEIGR